MTIFLATAGRNYPLSGAFLPLPLSAPYTTPLQVFICGGTTGSGGALDNCVTIAPESNNPTWTIERMVCMEYTTQNEIDANFGLAVETGDTLHGGIAGRNNPHREWRPTGKSWLCFGHSTKPECSSLRSYTPCGVSFLHSWQHHHPSHVPL